MSKKTSNELLNLVWGAVAFGSASRRVVMAVLADHSDDQGYSWPGIERIAAEAEVEEKTVRRSLKALSSDGWILVHAKSKGALHRHNSYTLNIPKLQGAQRSTAGIKSSHIMVNKSAVEHVRGQNVLCTADIEAPERASESAVLEPPRTNSRTIIEMPKTGMPSADSFLDAWNTNRGSLPAAAKLSDLRRKKLSVRVKDGLTIESFTAVVKIAALTPFLRGDNEWGWICGFDFLLREESFLKVLEGGYGVPDKPKATYVDVTDTPAAAGWLLNGVDVA